MEKKRNRGDDADMDVDEEGHNVKMGRFADAVVEDVDSKKAGPADRSCEDQ